MTDFTDIDMAKRLESQFGLNVDFRIKDAWDDGVAHEQINEGRYVTLIRKYANKTARGVYSLPTNWQDLVQAAKPVKQRKPRVANGPVGLPQVAAQPVAVPQQSATQVENQREFSRITSADIHYEPLQVPSKIDTYVPFGVSSKLKKLLRSGVFAPMYIVGDSGYGKTVAVEQACAETKRPLVVVQVTNETTEDDLIGGMRLIDGDSVFEYGPVIRAYKEGGVCLMDEMDQGTTALMCMQNILQRKPYFIKKTGETIYPHPDFMIIATGNTKGLGDDIEGQFAGAQILNEALLERFSATVEQFAPTQAVEKKILGQLTDDEEFISALVQWANITRESRKSGVISREIQTRRLVHIVTNYVAFGDKKTAIELALGRFDEQTGDSLLMMYTKIDPSFA